MGGGEGRGEEERKGKEMHKFRAIVAHYASCTFCGKELAWIYSTFSGMHAPTQTLQLYSYVRAAYFIFMMYSTALSLASFIFLVCSLACSVQIAISALYSLQDSSSVRKLPVLV